MRKHILRRALPLISLALASCSGGGGGGGSTQPPIGVIPTNQPSVSPSATPSPNASPSASPTAQPAASITLSPTNVFDFNAVGATYEQTIAVSEAGYSGAFTATTGCSTVVSVTSTTTTSFSITPLAAGSCIFEFTDSHNNESGPVYVQVTTTQVITE